MVRQRTPTQEERYLTAFESFASNGWISDPSWLKDLRTSAIERFRELGFPTARRGNEEWKYTDIAPIARTQLEVEVGDESKIGVASIEKFLVGDDNWGRLVFIDGAYSRELSRTPPLSRGVSVTSLAEASATMPDVLEKHLSRYARYDEAAFTALNTAFIEDGALVQVPDGAVLEQPLQLLFVSTTPEAMSAPRTLVIVGRDSKVTIVETYVGLTGGRYFANVVSEIAIGVGAVVNHYRVQQHSKEAFHVGTTQILQDRDSTFNSVVMDAGGALVRNNLNVDLAGENASCTLDGLYMVNGTQHVDNQVMIDHQQPYTTSRQNYKGILDGKSQAVFHGSITVREGARKADARQNDKNLLLSNECEADTKPALWIYCDDVKCGHGAASGQIDERALFYLQSRGVDQEAARRLLVRAFASEIIDSVKQEAVRAHMETIFDEHAQEYRLT